ncbi:MAG TPA: hypothetical protein VGV37_27730 [Aliidongia sp.]|uniref:hypothetical protein n=1 Tax=Aliidongia sp. TaxID=1914230 RepID=UPI002DDCD88C|nr:hypothetical protein [Aliidongia sp.]HEV2678350.1 hypothetical protein [Aliidongia sp.]
MATNAGHGHGHAHGHGHHRPAMPVGPSPLARGLGFRLGWAGGLSALLWLAVAWALQ